MAYAATSKGKDLRSFAPIEAEKEGLAKGARKSQARLLEMLTYRRPAWSWSEQEFIRKFIVPTGATADAFGNYSLKIGTAPVLWSSHTDSVHTMPGVQPVTTKDGYAFLDMNKGFLSNCLGADCATGVWLMLEMIAAGVEGLYLFHREEERGGGGAKWSAKNRADELKGYKVALAFDRKGYYDVIDWQGGRCASEHFCKGLGGMLHKLHKPVSGVYTDTAEYAELIPECLNISVGYFSAHTDQEVQDIWYATWLRNRMVKLDLSKMLELVKRDPAAWYSYSATPYKGGSGAYSHTSGSYWRDKYGSAPRQQQAAQPPFGGAVAGKSETLEALVRHYPAAVADYLEMYGVTAADLRQHINQAYGGGWGGWDGIGW